MNFRKPQKLSPGDHVAIISPSWGGPDVFPHIYENGLSILRDWGLHIVEFPTARTPNDILAKNPEMRAKDINDAFADQRIKAIFASIGGDDSMRILPFLNRALIAGNPKILMGYSDTTTLHTYLNLLGNVSLHGPAIMAGFSQINNMDTAFRHHVREFLFEPRPSYDYPVYDHYTDGYPDWSDPQNTGRCNTPLRNSGPRVLQGQGVAEGILCGGCIEVLEFLKATPYWPSADFWQGKILFFETSEDAPPVHNVKWMLRNYGLQGIFGKISALMFGRAARYSDAQKEELDRMIKDVVADEFKSPDLPIVTNMDFGHTDPQIILPVGIRAKLDTATGRLSLAESALTD